MKIKNLFLLFAIVAIGLVSCSEENPATETVETQLETQQPPAPPSDLDIKNADSSLKNDHPCCSYDWEVINTQSTPSGTCCNYTVSLTNNAECWIFWRNDYLAPGQTITFYNVWSCGDEISWPVWAWTGFGWIICSEIELAPDCSTAGPDPECTDCVFEISTPGFDTDVYHTDGILLGACEQGLIYACNDVSVLLTNDSGCSEQELIDAWKSTVNTVITFDEYVDCVESAITSLPGCADADVSITQNGSGGMDYTVSYCEECELNLFLVRERGFDMHGTDCKYVDVQTTEWGQYGGFTDCGACQ